MNFGNDLCETKSYLIWYTEVKFKVSDSPELFNSSRATGFFLHPLKT